ncbi:hypothetical protein [Epilithonimonas lactis]|uniref:Uncharacterized protein n=1 Tax=Epilithonimonas lactis TaxID=421072 RepID=A0A085BEF5_9FLAO|nr:hypothetical protein [Epilithonimonas lactis]KFC20850.1 hypothetical protein IO89_11450 [Epilithonimonas lactis]SEP63690.1 hypothetical protein SAMN04488097_0164 [Epilithonimonas lactis]
MKKITFLFLIFNYSFLTSQIKALTEDGREVVLLENKTWRFVNETDEKTLSDIQTNETPVIKSSASTFLMRSKKVDAGIYINPKKWKTIKMSVLPTAEYTFQSLIDPSTMILGSLMSENAPIQTLKNLRDILLGSIQSEADYFKLNKSEYRTVNGIKVLFIDYSLNTSGMDFHYIGNYYLTEDGYCNVVVFSYEKDFEKNQSEMLHLINGLVKTDKAQIKEAIEYAPPPPPMETKKK